MMKNRPSLRRARPGLLLAVVVAVILGLGLNAPMARADLPDFPDGYPKMGSSSEALDGLRLNGGHSTVLFPLHVAPGETYYAYCVELTVSAHWDIDVNVGGWDSFPGDNNFANSQQVRERVAWIVYNSYPHVTLDALRAETGQPGLTEAEAIAGTQASIWHLTNDFVYESVTGGDSDRVLEVYTYLTGELNVGRPETTGPEVAVTAPADAGRAGQLVGPIRITASEPTVAVTVTGDHPLVKADGTPVDLDVVPTNTELFFDVPVDAPAGNASLTATVTGPESTGLLVSNTDPRTQTLMIARSDQTSKSADAAVTWDAQPRITTSATDEADGDDYLDEGEVVVVDKVSYDGLMAGKAYELQGELMIRHADGTSTATGIVASKEFTPTSPTGEEELSFTIPADQLRGEVIVVFERLYEGKTEVAVHTDIDDEKQTVHRPRIATTAVDGVDQDKLLPQDGEATVTDTVTYSGLKVGKEYALAGTLFTRDSDGNPVDTGIIAETTFTPTSSSGTVDLTFTIPDGELRGETIVVFEELFDGATKVAEHADINDDFQTVYRPRIGTTASDAEDGDKHLPAQGKATVSDIVQYSGLEPGKEYTVRGELMVRDADGNAVPTGITSELTFTPESPNGSVTVEFTIDADELLGETIVVFESLERDGVEVAVHANIDDQDQTVHRPRLGTSAVDGDDNDEFLPQRGSATVVDTVSYEGLRVGQNYTVRGELMIRDADGNAVPTGITSELTFTPESSDGTVELEFTIGEDQLLGSVIVVFERLHVDEVEVATHTDISDEAQTVYRPAIDTDAYDLADGDRLLDPDGATLRDDVTYSGLKIGATYVLRGEVMLHETGESTGITGSTSFVAEQSDGVVHVDFEIPDTYASKTLVVFEWLYLVSEDGTEEDAADDSGDGTDGEATSYDFGVDPLWASPIDESDDADDTVDPVELLLAVHTDLNAERQTVRVGTPPTPTTPPAAPSAPPLADTGALPGVAGAIGIAMLLLGGGIALMVTDRRRRLGRRMG